ncbi:hypothetical protein A2673_01440 [Candidatus Kaiserbacteria bacterium RIFCSPHIGHO2_01_FULL_50_13]|uniref:Glycosyltransferase subfamily 4-like N-terminal domain-containing protein n=1 Tax=Candidatus Kaiserbacteria bacterium RIFCSPLOWO2_01_FULL_50_24 TaxID=1798507 RepID=A0A1F6EID2_9BACT|nr:MAG: hypothetical protein A2673_01440 [Candidatus Kaiserbacteria bacterium RIFCSPHIGHO2_01_FULL_50_13]OGG73399.1 MAG: hypothetical protein A3A34_03170 [Candidatus Kaiserbacteria bacterium RIFCSPLOWO2_01_FULL_50_24]OGG81221.1 MAG: hypothetical protein A3H74_02145 [Candidatus Kaiserbacteria bacterium RIFCSPLOWO2_02_FULL_51_13]
MKKVLFLITKSNWGGAQRYVYDLATNLPKEQFEAVVACGGSGELIEKLHQHNIRTISIPYLERDISFFKEFLVFAAVLKILRKERPDVVHLNSSKAGGVGVLAARIVGIPKIIFTVHGWPFEERRSALVRKALWIASYLTALLSHTVVCVSDYDLRKARSMSGIHALRIYNGIDLHMSFERGEKIRSAFPPGVSITGTIGELTKNKNQQALIEEARDKPHMFVAIVGEGEERKNLETLIQKYNLDNRVKLFGFMLASKALRGFDSFAFPSLKEGLPYVLLEAKAAGIPIFANRVGGVGEVLDNDLEEFSITRMLQHTALLYKGTPPSDSVLSSA